MTKTICFTIVFLAVSTYVCASAKHFDKFINTTSKTISIGALAKDTNNKIYQKNESEKKINQIDSSIKSLKEEKEKKEDYYNRLIDEEKRKKVEKDEFETTNDFKKRLSEQESKISSLSASKDAIINEYDKKIADQESKITNIKSTTSWDSFFGIFSVSNITLLYNVSSIQYDADTGVFDITLVLDEKNYLYRVSNNLTVSCKSPDLTIKYQKHIPNITEAKKFKSSFKKAIVSIPDIRMTRYYQNICVKEGYNEKHTNTDNIAANATEVGLAVLLTGIVSSLGGELPSNTFDGAANRPIYEERYIPPVYENYLIFELDSYKEYEKASIIEIVNDSALLEKENKSLISNLLPMIKDSGWTIEEDVDSNMIQSLPYITNTLSYVLWHEEQEKARDSKWKVKPDSRERKKIKLPEGPRLTRMAMQEAASRKYGYLRYNGYSDEQIAQMILEKYYKSALVESTGNNEVNEHTNVSADQWDKWKSLLANKALIEENADIRPSERDATLKKYIKQIEEAWNSAGTE